MQVRHLFIAALITILSSLNGSADRQDTAEAALKYASRVTLAYQHVNDDKKLFDADRTVETAFRDLVYYYGTNSDLARDLALIRAKSATSRKDKSRVADAWSLALELQPADLAADKRLTLNLQAATATAIVGDTGASTQYFAAARTYAFAKDRDARALQLQLRIQELRSLAQQMTWRQLRDRLLDMRQFSEGFSMWTVPRLDALASEAEIRLLYQPEAEEKRITLADLKSKVDLMMKGMGHVLMPANIERIRTLYYSLEDNYQLTSDNSVK